MADDELRQQLIITVDSLTSVIKQLTRRITAIEDVLGPGPHTTGPLSYLSGRWIRRNGTSYGQPVA